MTSVWDIVTEADEKSEDGKSPEEQTTNYGEDAPVDEPEIEAEDGETEDEEIDPEEAGATDYGEDVPEDDETPDADGSTDTDDGESSETPEEDKKNSALVDDYLNLYYSMQGVINRLSKVDKSNMNINKVVTQVISNLISIREALFEHFRFSFAKTNYTGNLLKYNYFIEAYKINVAILRKTKGLQTFSQNNTVKNIRKEVR